MAHESSLKDASTDTLTSRPLISVYCFAAFAAAVFTRASSFLREWTVTSGSRILSMAWAWEIQMHWPSIQELKAYFGDDALQQLRVTILRRRKFSDLSTSFSEKILKQLLSSLEYAQTRLVGRS